MSTCCNVCGAKLSADDVKALRAICQRDLGLPVPKRYEAKARELVERKFLQISPWGAPGEFAVEMGHHDIDFLFR